MQLARLTKLETLILDSNTGITDVAIDHLAKLATLKTLVIGQTGITHEGVARLRAALPRCQIVPE